MPDLGKSLSPVVCTCFCYEHARHTHSTQTIRVINVVTPLCVTQVNLINEANVSPPATLDTVTKQWEEIYQGTDTTPGLWEIEDLLVGHIRGRF